MIEQKKRYFLGPENYFEWFVMLLAVANIVMTFETVEVEESVRRQWQRHLGAFCILLAFIQLYMLLVRIAPNTPIPVYINMFTTVLKTYTFILLRCVLTDYPIQSIHFQKVFYPLKNLKPKDDPYLTTRIFGRL